MSKAIFIDKPDKTSIHGLYSEPETQNNPPQDQKTLILMCHHFPGDCNGTQDILLHLEKTALKKGLFTLRFDFSHCGNSDGEEKDFALDEAISDLKTMIAWAKKQNFQNIGLFSEGLGSLVSLIVGDKYIDFLVMAYPFIDIDDAYSPVNIDEKQQKKCEKFLKELPDYNIEKYLENFKKPSLIFYGTKDTERSSVHLNILRESLGSKRIDMTSIKEGTFGLPETASRKAISMNLGVFLEKYVSY